MDLNAIKFNVKTEELQRAIDEIDDVATALGNMSSKVKEATKTKQDAAKADKEAIANATALAKLKQEEAKAISLAAKASADEAKAKEAQSNSTKKVVEASESQVKAADKVTEALSGTDRILAKQALSMQILRGEIVSTSDGVVSLGNGFTKSQSSMLANLQLLGATGKEMQTLARSFEDYNRITGLNTFDKSASGISKLKKELAELNQINSISASGMSLTRDEIVNYMRDSERLVQKQKSEGHSAEWLAQEQAALKAAYMTTATELNRLRAESKQMEDQAKREAQAKIKAAQDVSKAQAFVNKEMERANAAYLAAVGDDKLNVSTSNRLLKMEQALKATGMSAQQAEAQLAQYKRTLAAVQKASSDRAVDTISRALGPQITDITVGLATGQSLMTVLLQQGGQLRDQMALAGVAADQMGVAIRKAGSEMVSSVWATGKGVIGGIAGAFLDLGRSAGVAFAQSLSGAQKFVTSMFLSQAAAENYAKGLDSAFSKTGRFINFMENSKAAATVFAGGIAVLATTLISLGVAFVKASNESDNLVKTLSLNSAALGLNASTAYSLAASYKDLGVTVTSSIEALSEMAKTGSFTRTQIDILTPSIVRLNKAAGEDMQTTVARFKELGKDPVKALFDLQAALGTVPPEMIKAAIEAERMGDAMKAMEIATQAADVAAERAAQNIKLYYSPLGSLFNTLKEGAGKMWDAILNVGRGKSAQQVVQDATQSILNLEKDILKAQGMKSSIVFDKQGYISSLQRQMDEQRKKIADAYPQLVKDAVTAEENAANAVEAQRMELVRRMYSPADALKAKAKGLTMNEYIEQAWTLADPKGEARKASTATKEFLEAMDAKFRKEWEDIQNKGASKLSGGSSRKPQAPGLFDIGLETGRASNALSEVKKFYDAQSSILENSYKANEISLGSYLSQELTLIENQANKKREIQANLIEQLDLQEQSELSKLEKWKSTLTETEDKKRAEKMITDTKDRYQKARESAQSSIIGLVDDTKNAVAKAMQELVKLSQDSAKLFEDFRRGITEREESRRLEIEDARLSSNLSGEQLAAEKARVAEMRNVSKQIIEQADLVAKLEEAYARMTLEGRFDESSEAFKAWQAAIKRKTQMETDAKLAGDKAAIDGSMKYQLEQYAKLKDGIADALTTALFEGGKAGSKKLREVLMAELRKPIAVVINVVANVITGEISSLLGISGASASGIAGNAGSLLSGASGLKSIYDAISGGFGAMAANVGSTLASFGMKFGSAALQSFGEGVAMSGTGIGPGGVPISAGSGVGGLSGASQAGYYAGSAAMIAAGIFGGQSLGRLASNGYSAWGGASGSSAINTGQAAGTAIGAILGGPIGAGIGALIGGLAGGLTNSLFGRKLTQSGIEGTFSGESFSGNRYEFLKGGTFRSNKTKRYALDSETTSSLSNSFNILKDQYVGLASWFKTETVSAVEGYSKYIKINLKGKSQEQIDQIFTDLFNGMAEDMAKLVLAGTNFSKKGETAVQTLDRLKTNLLGVNQVLDTLGMTLFDISLLSGDMTSALADSFGGLDKLQSATANYYEKFYSEEEKLATATRQLTSTFAAMGLTLPATRDAFKDLVAAQDLTTAAGQLTFTALIGLSDVFYEITNPLEEATQKMKEFTNSILEYINSLSMSEGNASQNYAYAQAVFGQQLLLAKAGDETAMENITSYSDKLIELAKSNAGSALEFETILGSIKAELLGLATTAPAGSVLTSGLTPSALSASPVVSTASQIAEQTVTTQTLLANILTKLTEMQAEDRAEGVQNVVNLNSIAKVVKRIDNGDSIRTFAVTV